MLGDDGYAMVERVSQELLRDGGVSDQAYGSGSGQFRDGTKMMDGVLNGMTHQMNPVHSPFTVAIQRSIAHCKGFVNGFSDLRYGCSGCLDRVLKDDY